MAVKSFTPFKAGGKIVASGWNTAFGADGLTGALDAITGDQVSKEGITLDVCNKGMNTTADGVAGGGAPHHFGYREDRVVSHFKYQGLGDRFVASTGGTPLTVDWTDTLDNLQFGDVVIVEFVGNLDVVQYGQLGWNPGGTATNFAKTLPPIWVDGTQSWDDYYGSLSFVQATTAGVWEEPAQSTHLIHYFSPWMSAADGLDLGPTTQVAYTKAANVFDGATNSGPGAKLDFRMVMAYPILGNETNLEFSVTCKPAAGPGDQTDAIAAPGMKVYSGADLYSYVIRRAIV